MAGAFGFLTLIQQSSPTGVASGAALTRCLAADLENRSIAFFGSIERDTWM